ncbi:hypothetical protein QUC31_002314 [Theobroma cacao]
MHFLYINCGGREENVNGTTYEADYGTAGPSTFFQSTNTWAFSNTGIFLGDDRSDDIYVSENMQLLMIDELYRTARLSPSSLTYYAFCLANRTYNISLHFAEIQFADGQNFSSLGRRIFDVYIQAHILKEKGNLLDLVDPRIGSECNIEEVMAMINVALLCTNPTAAARPSMSSVVSMLEGRAAISEFIDSSFSAKEMNAEAMKKLYQQLEQNDADNSQTKSMLSDGPWTSSSTSAADLYPVNLTSGYWQNRDSTN